MTKLKELHALKYNLGGGFILELSAENCRETYLLGDFESENSEHMLELATKATANLTDCPEIITEILAVIKQYFPNRFRFAFKGSKLPFSLLNSIAQDERFEVDGVYVKCDMRTINIDGLLILKKERHDPNRNETL